MHHSKETIAAIATPSGEGGISIVRISGKRAIEVAATIFSGPVSTYLSHSAHLGVVSDLNGDRLDEALLLIMRAPRSYTGEDTIELQCHGGEIAARLALQAVISAGARIAQPGEFTLRAFMNGKLDLSQAEAVQQLIAAKSDKAFHAASQHLSGKLSAKIHLLQEKLISLLATLEACIDFPEEDLLFLSVDNILGGLKEVQEGIECLVASFDIGQKISQDIKVCIVGMPNVGKSSLMNALLDYERAIVTPIAGTTRDVLTEGLRIKGKPFCLLDTAGLRDTADPIEIEGVRRSREAIEKADIILLVVDATRDSVQEERALLETLLANKTIVVWNKVDVEAARFELFEHPNQIEVSARGQIGIYELKEAIDKLAWDGVFWDNDEVLITQERHREALKESLDHLSRVITGLNDGTERELVAIDLRDSLVSLGRIIGMDITEDLLSSIFSQFCVGK